MKKTLFHRDISWLSFNYRVLEEAKDETLPLYERIKFLSIFSSNLEEFFRVRIGALRQYVQITKDMKVERILQKINKLVHQQQVEFGAIFNTKILPALNKENIHLIQGEEYTPSQRKQIDQYFQNEVMHLMQPLMLVKDKVVPFLEDRALYFIVTLVPKKKEKNSKDEPEVLSIIKIPTDKLSRFYTLPEENGKYFITFLDDIIRVNLGKIYGGYSISSAFSFKISRNADFKIEDEFEGNLLEKIKISINKRKTGIPSRFLYDEEMPPLVLSFLKRTFKLKKSELVPGAKYHNFYDFMSFPNPLSPKLEHPHFVNISIPHLDNCKSILDKIKKNDILLHFPYHSYDYVVRFLTEAAYNPKVKEIKATQYRVAANSAIVNALISAARNGKDVTVFVELKARFDEELNIHFAKKMEENGVKIIYSLPGLKVHAKSILVNYESKNKTKSLAFLSTGNFNEKTARIYSDVGLFTANQEITKELNNFFDFLNNTKQIHKYKHLLPANTVMAKKFLQKIDREIKNASEGLPSKIILKVNNLEDEKMIQRLYKAADAGVQIEIIVRSVCRIIPQKNIKVIRIVDRFLEHARIIIFENNGQPEIYISSADWMTRNLYHRIELAVPILDKNLQSEILDIINIQLQDNTKARIIGKNLKNQIIKPGKNKKTSAQKATFEYLQNKSVNS